MKAKNRSWRQVCTVSGVVTMLGALLFLLTVGTRDSEAGGFRFWRSQQGCDDHGGWSSNFEGIQTAGELGGTWYWMRSPEQEKVAMMGLYNRYCIRCHGVDGRGIWDIPNVPDFTNDRWQASRSDSQLTRAILEGRGACMPPFRGTLTLEEGWAMGRYLRTFVPGTEISPPDVGQSKKPATSPKK
jgi:hypothetical protein